VNEASNEAPLLRRYLQRVIPRMDGEGPRERVRERVTFWLYRVGEQVISAIPRALSMPAAAAVGNVAYDLAGRKQRLIAENLSRPMRLPADDPRVRHAARRAFRNYAKYLVDMMRIAGLTEDDARRLVSIENVEILHEARAEGRGVLLCGAHVGGMDMIGPALKGVGEALHVVADDTTYGRLYDHLAAARARQHIFLIGWRNLRGMFRVLRDNQNLVLFCDGGYRRGDVPVELCGEPTTLPIGPATLSAKTGAPMVAVACRRTSDDRFVARGLPLIHCAGTDPVEIQRATQAVADKLSSVLEDEPEQWYMFRPVWPRTDADRRHAAESLAAARRGEDWTKIGA
jgi:phosphatidylinositol dimannoside acyltransferase